MLTGYLHGFDKSMNLVLMNVDEKYTVMVPVPHFFTVMLSGLGACRLPSRL